MSEKGTEITDEIPAAEGYDYIVPEGINEFIPEESEERSGSHSFNRNAEDAAGEMECVSIPAEEY